MPAVQIASIDHLEPRRLLAATTALHVNAGGDVYTDRHARTFSVGHEPAGGFGGGTNLSATVPDAANVPDATLFENARIGTHFTYAAPATPGRYALFVEFLDPLSTAAGQRVFDVSAEGKSVADNVDLYARAANGPFAIERDLVVNDGALNLSFDADVGDALVSAIVLLPLDAPPAVAASEVRNTTADAMRAVSLSNLRQIMFGAMEYANDHRNAAPSSVTDLVAEGDVSFEAFSNPRSDTPLPRGVLSAVEQLAWTAAHNDYLYLKPTIKFSQLKATDPVFYENPDRASGDINVGWGDGHTSTVTRAQAAAMFGFDANTPPTGAYPPPTTYLPGDALVNQSWTKLHAIATAIQKYANEHSGRIPARIGVLVEAGYASATLFSNPRLAANAAPPPPTGSTATQAGAWIDAHSDYVMTNAGKSLSSVSWLEALLYEKPAGLSDGVSGALDIATGAGFTALREARWAFETIADQAGPIAVASSFDVDANAVRIRFDEDATAGLAAGDLVVTNLTTGQTIPSAAAHVEYDFLTQTATFSFPGLLHGNLPDGNYIATLAAGSVADPQNTAMADSTSVSFFSLAGDINHDRVVDFNDLVILAQHYGLTGQPFSNGNLDRDIAGRVDFDDLVILAQRYGAQIGSIPAAILAPPMTPLAAPLAASPRKRSTVLPG